MFKFVVLFLATMLSFAFPPALLVVIPLDILAVRRYFATLAYQRRATFTSLQHREIMAVGRQFGGRR